LYRIFTYVLKIYLSWIYPLYHSPSSRLPSLVRPISTGFILLFSYMDTKHTHYINPSSPFPRAHPLLLTSGKDLFFSPALHFFKIKCILIIQRGIVLVLPVCIYRALTTLIHSPYYLLIIYHHAPIIFNII
jgi:hypothetical protein